MFVNSNEEKLNENHNEKKKSRRSDRHSYNVNNNMYI